MVTLDARSDTRVCSWDSLPNGSYDLFTTGNVEEIVPGVIKPLIADLFRQMDYRGLTEMLERIGVSDLIEVFEPPRANFLPVFAGRMALNLAWANALIATWQTSEDGSGLMDQFITTSEADIRSGANTDPVRAAEVQKRVFSSFWPQCAAAIDRNNERLNDAHARLAGTDLAALSVAALWKRFDTLLATQAHLFVNHIGVSGAAGEYASLLGKLLARELGEGFEERMVPGLTTGLGEVESAKPGFELWKLGRLVAARPKLAKAFAQAPAAELAGLVARPPDPEWKAFARGFRTFIDAYGFRGQQEADPSVPSWADDPTFVLSVIRANARADESRDPQLYSAAALKARHALENDLANRVSRGARREFLRISGLAQHYARNRERTKAAWVRAMRLSRPVLLELARRASAARVIDDAADFFYLTWDEVAAFAAGETVDCAGGVAARRREAAEMENVLPPALFAAPPLVERIRPAPAVAAALAGLGVSAGTATGNARVIRSAAAAVSADLQPGEVLVAPFTDAAWTPLFVPASAVIVETGGMLSHAAIVAREFGIPAVVAVQGATQLIRDGQTVTVDGASGMVTFG